LLAGFCHKTVVFGAAFSDAWFAPAGPKGIEVTGDGAKHFLDDGRDDSGFVFDPGCRIGKLTQGVQSAFAGDAAQINIVGEGSLLHEAAEEIVDNEVPAQFAFDHRRGEAAQDVHVEGDFDLAEMEFDGPVCHDN